MENQAIKVLLKDHESMRAEIRMYINKYYFALTAIISLITIGLFQSKENQIVYIWIPYAVSALMGFLSMVDFFVNKAAGYVSLLEKRLAVYTNTGYPSCPLDRTRPLALIFWESYYADKGLGRDENSFVNIFALPVTFILVPSFVMVGIIVNKGHYLIMKDSPGWEWYYTISSCIVLLFSCLSLIITNRIVRDMTRRLNSSILSAHNSRTAQDLGN